MKECMPLLLAVFLTCQSAMAGPNEGITLTVQANVTGADTNGDPCSIPVPGDCKETTPGQAIPVDGVEWFLILAAGGPTQAFTLVTFGVGEYNTSDCYVAFYGPCHADLGPLEIVSAGWPFPYSGTSVSWSPNCVEGMLTPVYYFGIYASAPGTIPLGDFYPGSPAYVTSCTSPPFDDPIAGFGNLGYGGADGEQACPFFEPDFGACCLPDGECAMLSDIECIGAGGEFYGGFCEEIQCETSSVPGGGEEPAVRGTSWGRIKAIYR